MTTFTFEQMMALMGVVMAGALILIALSRWLLSRMDHVSTTAVRAHVRIDAIPEIYIRREEVMDHFKRIEEAVENGRSDTNDRLDRLYELLYAQANQS